MRISYKDLGLACLSAALLILSFPSFDFGALAWAALVPLLIALDGKRPSQAFVLSHVAGVIFYVGVLFWIWSVPAWNLLDEFLIGGIYLALYVSLWGLGLNWIRARTALPAALIAPVLWVTLEYVRSHLGFLAFPWMLLGHSQYLYPFLVQLSALTGVYGLSFLIVLATVAIADAILHRPNARFAPNGRSILRRIPLSLVAAAALLLLTSLYGLAVLPRGGSGESLSIALVQGNIPQEQKWDGRHREAILERYAGLTRLAARQAPALIVWPETAVPGDLGHDQNLQRRLGRLAVETKTPLLVGAAENAKFTTKKLEDKFYNSVFLISTDGRVEGQYRKMLLVPFSEYAPLRDLVTWPKAIVSGAGDYVPGDRYTLFTVGPATFGAVICWEAIFPNFVREFVNRGARFLVVATNEAHFRETAAPYQLLAMSVFRAAENRIAIARSANTGISALIDPFGRITHRLRGAAQKELFVEGVLVGAIAVSGSSTFYTRYGDVFAVLQVAGSAILLLLALSLPRLANGRRASPKGSRLPQAVGQ